LTPATTDRADYHWHFELAAKHIVQFWRLIHDVIHRGECKVDSHQLCNGALPNHRSTNCRTDDCVFSDRRIFDAVRSVFIIETLGHRVGAAPDAYLFADDKDGGIAVHFFHKCLRDRLAHCDFCHIFLFIMSLRVFEKQSPTYEDASRLWAKNALAMT